MNTARILICEDDALVADDLSRRVSKLGYLVSGIAATEQQAFKLASAHHPDIALMDISLSGAMSGVEIATVLRRDYQIPSIYITAHSEAEIIEQADDSDPLGYLIKPAQDHELALTIRYGLAQHQARGNLERQLEDVTKQAETTKKILTSFRSAIASEARMDGLRDIIGGIAHHFGNSLLALGLPLEVLATGGTLKSFELRLIKRVIARLAGEADFLRRLRWASGQTGLTLSVNSAADLIRTIVAQRAASMHPGTTLDLQMAEGRLEFFFDREAVGQAITSLLNNASEALPESGGTIVVAVKQTEISRPELRSSVAEAGMFLHISVFDSGSGIPKKDLAHVAEPFFTTRLKRDAPGLGLTEAYGIAHAHGGWLSLLSSENNGTVVQIFLPLSSTARDQKRSLAQTDKPARDGFVYSDRIGKPIDLSSVRDGEELGEVRQFGYL